MTLGKTDADKRWHFDAIIIGAGAAGLMCAIEAARRGRRVVVLDHADAPAEKIRISGGGKCNFTNLKTTPKNFISDNPHFCISALKRFTAQNFLDRVISHNIAYYEKTEGQLFCVTSAQDIIDMLLKDLADADGQLWLNTHINKVDKTEAGFRISTTHGPLTCSNLIIATGGLSIPKMATSGFAYEIAQKFGHDIIERRAGLVPFTLGGDQLLAIDGLSGISQMVSVKLNKIVFNDWLLFTHRGLSGPAMLQISNYWRPGQALEINLLPDINLGDWLKDKRQNKPKQSLSTALGELMPRRLSDRILEWQSFAGEVKLSDLSNASIIQLQNAINKWDITPDGTEGYRTAEVTLGGVDTRKISSQTMQSQTCAGLYFIGEALDVTGWLGGYNFQWAWSSGWAAGQVV